MGRVITADAVREALNVTFCPTCGCDTMPNDRTGACFFCNTIIDAELAPPEDPAVRICVEGHRIEGDNVYYYRPGTRPVCRECWRAKRAAWNRQRRRELAAERKAA